MSRAVLVLNTDKVRDTARKWVGEAKPGTRVEFKAPRRSLPQNDAFWAAMTDIARQAVWHGERLSPEDWRLLFLDALNRDAQVVPSLDGRGYVELRRTSDLSKEEFSDLLEVVYAWCAQNNISLSQQVPA